MCHELAKEIPLSDGGIEVAVGRRCLAVEVDVGGASAFEPMALVRALEVVPVHEELEVVFQFLERGVDFAAHGWLIELVEQGLVETFAAPIGPGMARLDEVEPDVEALGELVERMVAVALVVFPSSRGELGAVVLQEAMDAEVFGFGHEMVLDEVAHVVRVSCGVELDHGVTGGQIDGEVVVDRADALDAADQKGVLSPALAGVGDVEMASFGAFSGGLEFGLGDDLAQLHAGPFLAVSTFVEPVASEHAMHAGVAHRDAAAELVGDSDGSVSGVEFDVVEDEGLVLEGGAVVWASSGFAAEQGLWPSGGVCFEPGSQRVARGGVGQPAIGALGEATGVEHSNMV